MKKRGPQSHKPDSLLEEKASCDNARGPTAAVLLSVIEVPPAHTRTKSTFPKRTFPDTPNAIC